MSWMDQRRTADQGARRRIANRVPRGCTSPLSRRRLRDSEQLEDRAIPGALLVGWPGPLGLDLTPRSSHAIDAFDSTVQQQGKAGAKLSILPKQEEPANLRLSAQNLTPPSSQQAPPPFRFHNVFQAAPDSSWSLDSDLHGDDNSLAPQNPDDDGSAAPGQRGPARLPASSPSASGTATRGPAGTPANGVSSSSAGSGMGSGGGQNSNVHPATQSNASLPFAGASTVTQTSSTATSTMASAVSQPSLSQPPVLVSPTTTVSTSSSSPSASTVASTTASPSDGSQALAAFATPAAAPAVTTPTVTGTSTPATSQTSGTASPGGLLGDVNHDGVVNGLDLSRVAANWMATGTNQADANDDGIVNGLDISLITSHWLQTTSAPATTGAPAQSLNFTGGLTGWTVGQQGGSTSGQGSVVADQGAALLTEGDSLLVTMKRSFTVPAGAKQLDFTYHDLSFDTTAQNSIKDAFEVALVDNQGNTLVQTIGSGRDSFFNISEGQPAALGSGASINGTTVAVDLSGVTAGTQATLVFRLVNNDSDHLTHVRIANVDIPTTTPELSPTASKDDGDWAYRERGLWSTGQPNISGDVGWQGDYRSHSAGTGVDTATWSIPITAGQYEVFATWVADPSNATNAPYSILDGSASIGSVTKDQSRVPSDGAYSNRMWSSLGAYTFTTGVASIVLSDQANGCVVADGMILVPVSQVSQSPPSSSTSQSAIATVTATAAPPPVTDSSTTTVYSTASNLNAVNSATTAAQPGNGINSANPDVSTSTPSTIPTTLDATVKYAKSTFSVLPQSNQVMMTPAVIDLYHDGSPDIIFSTFAANQAGGNSAPGVLRAIRGSDGQELWTVTDPNLQVEAYAGIAVGDLDGDGNIEIIAHNTSNEILCFNHDGSLKWRSAPLPENLEWGSASIADLNHDGFAEIVIGSTVLDHNGNILWSGSAGTGDNRVGPLSLVADLNLDGSPEIVAGNTAYHADGSIYWHNTSVPDGFDAVGNFNADAFPEIVEVSQGNVYLLDHTGSIIWGPKAVPGGGYGGAPTIADFDGGGKPEIGVAGGSDYTVFKTDGTVLWSKPTQDLSSNVTGSSVYDFNGDGRAEVVYGDEQYLRIYDGVTGSELYKLPKSSGTTYELPVVADVFGDGSTEIVAAANDYAFGSQNGIYVIGSASNSWVPTRPIWNQQTYHITNINDDGTIPRNELNSWELYNNYRRNLQPTGTLAPPPTISVTPAPQTLPAGTSIVVSGIATANGSVANGSANTITAVAINGAPVDELDAAGDFFAKVIIAPGVNTFTFTATDAVGQTVSASISVTGSPPSASQALFDSLSDVSGSIQGVYAGTSFNETTKQLYADMAVQDTGTYSVDKPLMVGITDISNPLVRVQNADGVTPDGTPYFDYSSLVAGQMLSPGAQTGFHTLDFSDPNDVPFTYNLVFVGQLNRPPAITTVPPVQALAGQTYSYQVGATDPDGDPVTFQLSIAPTGMTIDSATGTITWNPTTSDLGTTDVTVIASDGRGGTAQQHYILSTITPPPNRPPVFTSVPVVSATVSAPLPDAPNLIENGSFESYAVPESAWTLPGTANHGVPVGNTAIAGWTVVNGNIDYVIGWQASDGAASIDLGGNPGAGGLQQQIATVPGQAYELSFDLSGNPDRSTPQFAAESPIKTVRVTAGTLTENFSYNTAATGNTFTNMDWQHESFDFVATSDHTALTFLNTMGAVYTGPVIDNVVVKAAGTGSYEYDAHAVDPDGDPVTYSLLADATHQVPVGMTIDSASGVIAWAPTAGDIGTHTLTVQASDGRGGVASQTFSIFVRPDPTDHPPVIISTPVTSFDSGASYSYHVVALDPDSDALTFSLTAAPSGMAINSATGVISWTPNLADRGPDNVTVRVDDGRGGFDTQTYSIAVNLTSIQGRVFQDDSPTSNIASWVDWTSATLGTNGNATGVISVPGSGNVSVSYSGEIYAAQTTPGINYWIPSSPYQSALVTNPPSSSDIIENIGGTTEVDTLTFSAPVTNPVMAINSLGSTSIEAKYIFNEPFSILSEGTGYWGGGPNTLTQLPENVLDGHEGSGLIQFSGVFKSISWTDPLAEGWHGFTVGILGAASATSETGLSGWTVYLDLNHDGHLDPGDPFTTTDMNGNYSFTNVAPGVYTVGEVPQSGWVQTAPSGLTYEVTVGDGQTIASIDFGNKETTTTNQNPIISSTAPVAASTDQLYRYNVAASDPDGDSLAFDLTVAPAGMAVDPTTGVVVWTPTADELGSQNVVLRVQDGRGGVALQSFQVAVTATDTAPTITSTPPGPATVGLPYQYQVTAQDADGDPLTYSLPTGPTGMSIDSSTGLLQWNPSGIPSTIVTSSDATWRSVAAQPAAGWNTDPLFDDTNSAGWHSALNVGQVGGFVQGGISGIWDSGGVSSGPLECWLRKTFDLSSVPPTALLRFEVDDDADVYINGHQVISDHSGNASDLGYTDVTQYLTTGMNLIAVHAIDYGGNHGVIAQLTTPGSTPVTVQVSDGRGGTATQSFSLSVVSSAPNSPPTISSTPPTSVLLGHTFSYQVAAADPDGDPLVYSLTTNPTGMAITAAGLIQWTPTAAQLGPANVVLSVSDGRGGVATQPFTIQVVSQPVTGAPQIVSNPPGSATVGSLYAYNVQATDTIGGAILWDLDQAPQGMSIDPTQGFIRWTPSAGELGSQSVVVRATDTQGAAVTQTFSISVYSVNLPPSINSTPPTQAAVGQVYSYAVGASDPNSDTLSFSLPIAPTGMTINASTGLILWTPTAGQVGLQLVTVQASDGNGGVVQQSYGIGVNSAAPIGNPQITSSPPAPSSVGSLYQYQVTATDPNGQAVTFGLVQAPTGMTINPVSGLLQWTPTAGQLGSQSVTITVADSLGGQGTQSFSLPVLPLDHPPSFTSTPPLTVSAGATYSYDVRSTDPDGDLLSIALTTAPAGMTIDNLGRLRWATTTANIGTFNVVLQISDGRGGIATQPFQLSVVPDTQPPKVALTLSEDPVSLGDTVTVQVSATDDVGVVSRALSVNGTPIALSASGQGTFVASVAGPLNYVATASDAAGNTGQATATSTVFDPHVTNAPDVEITSPTADQEITSAFDVIGTVNDPNLSFYKLEIGTPGSNNFTVIAQGTTSVVNGVLGTIDPSQLSNDAYVLRLTAENTGLQISTIEVNFSVSGKLKLGDFTRTFTDLTVPVSGIPIVLERTYDTLTANQQGDFGYGWRMEYRDTDLRTSVAPTSAEEQDLGIYNGFYYGAHVYVTLPGGQREGFTFEPQPAPGYKGSFLGIYEPNFVPDPGVTDTLSVPAADLSVDPATGVATDWSDGTAYNPASPYFDGAEYTLTTKEGIVYQINSTTGKMDSVSDANGNKLTFSDSGITSSSGQQITFQRDPQGRITAVIDPAGQKINYQYDVAGNLTGVTDRQGNTTTFQYRTDLPHHLDKVIDPLNRPVEQTAYDSSGRLSQLIDAGGKTVSIAYDPADFTETTTDQLGNPTTYVYDQQGNIITEVDALGGKSTRTYDANNNLLSETDPLGHTTSHTYDVHGNVLSTTDANGQITRFTYDAFNRLLSTTDPLGNTTTRTYDAAGNLLSTTDPSGAAITAAYDANGNPVSATISGSGTATFSYTAAGQVASQTDSLGHSIQFTYDASGNQLTQTTTLTTPSGVRTLVTSTQYDSNGRVIQVTDADGGVTKTRYDAAGQKTADIDALGRATSYQYNDRGELTVTIYPDGTRTQTEYDAAGHVTAQIDESGRRTQYTYDALGRKTVTTLPDGTTTQTSYDAAGNVATTTDAVGNVTTYEYDADNRLIATILPDKTPENSTDNPRITEQYDASGRQIATTDPLGHTTQYVYDNLGRLTETIYADGTTSSTTYNAASEPLTKTDQNGHITTDQYDAVGRLTAVIDSAGNTTSYAYDEAGDLVTQTDANGHVTHYEYDGLGHRIATVLPLGQRSTTAYDAAGNVTSTTDFNGQTITYAYDTMNRLVTKTYPDHTTVTYTYTLDGQPATVTDARGTTSYSYDTMDRLLLETDPDGSTLGYTYDAAGNRTSLILSAGTTTYTYDAQNRLSSVTDAQGGVTSYQYDLAGNLVRTDLPNGTAEIRQYDSLNRLLYIENDGPSGVIDSFRYTLDNAGNRTRVVENTGREVDYLYDALDRLTEEKIIDSVAGNRTIDYTYDAVGNRLTMNDSAAGLTSYTYDHNDRLLTETLAAAVTQYSYDNNGDVLSKVASATDQIFYHWNFDLQLASEDVTQGATTQHIQDQYDASGNRVSQTVDNTQTLYLIDKNLPLAQMVAQYTPGGVLLATYTFGNQIISERQNGATSYYHVDGLGSVRALSNAAGAVTDRYVYDAYGRTLSQTGTTANPFLFAGQQSDGNSGLYYMRARYYSPTEGRFYGQDPVASKQQNPITLDRYLYTGDSPVSRIDPSGQQFDLVDLAISVAVDTVETWTPGTRTSVSGDPANSAIANGSVTANVWDETPSGIGHASLLLNQFNTYISWWPGESLDNALNILKVFTVGVNGFAQTWAWDIGSAGEGRLPDHPVSIKGLDQQAINQWWTQFNPSNQKYSLWQECSTVVADALKAGVTSQTTSLVGRIVIGYAYNEYAPLWFPADALQFAELIKRFQGG